ncbi:chemotaxis protein CheD [Cesiribacter andamanensis]|uniref:Probable chemoreceptor glutamine deamidase CheD n=1 Tax=Cesiribacter andamanensis AMV16 TaxID=1279009 RepID=M7N9V2_9BACT|nr:chemotaxis protein CheD [Cesiribacter andamanensis]EMR03986.1 Chemoreceptor glutamine deamidase CheD [Cesiribacter andamanensis AMV16]
MELLDKKFLYPATVFASKSPTLVTTILGTCVAVCLFDPISKIGGINHFMLASWDGNGLPSARFGDRAMQQLLERMQQLGADRRSLQARVYGGLCRKSGGDHFNIGAKNIGMARSLLSQLQIPVLTLDVGGRSPRKLAFQTHTGTVKIDLLLPEKIR